MKLPQLSLRELFLIVVIAAMGCAWWLDRASLRRQLLAQGHSIKLITLVNGTASEVAASIRGIFPDGNLEVSSDARTNTVIIRGDQLTLDAAESAVLRLDTPGETATAP